MDYKSALERVNFDLQAKIGEFLQTGQKIYALKDRVGPYIEKGNEPTRKVAVALMAKLDGMLANFKSLQNYAMGLAMQAADYKTALEKDPQFTTVDGVSPNPATWGAYLKNLYESKIVKAAGIIKEGSVVAVRIAAHSKAVDNAAYEVADLDAFAQGKGLSARLAQVVSGVTGVGGVLASTWKGAIWIVAGVAAVAVAMPYLTKGVVQGARRGMRS